MYITARVARTLFNSHHNLSRCPRKFAPPPKLWPLRAKFPRKFAPPPSEIWPPRKHSLLYRCKLGNREASSKTRILKVFVSIYSWFAYFICVEILHCGQELKFGGRRSNNVLLQSCQTHHAWVSTIC